MKPKKISIFTILGLLILPLGAFAATGTIDPTAKYAWGSNTGYVNFNPTNGSVQVSDTALTGYVWSDTYGWINLAPTNSGVKNDGTGILSGYAWGENTGYISFYGVRIGATGIFSGTATSSVIGTLNFDCSNCKVLTTWHTASLGGGGSAPSGGGGGVSSGGSPTPPTTSTPSPTPSQSSNSGAAATPAPSGIPPQSTLPFTAPTALRLINDNGTFYLVQNGQRRGTTNPGMLFSYGFEFKDASVATAEDLALPKGSPLLPNNGYLVKSMQDKTVYLISGNQRHGFVSAKVFTELGFKFSSVLVVTNPELQKLPLGDNIVNSISSHLDGVSISNNNEVFWIMGRVRYPYPSLEVYNSWNIDNDFSRVVPANAEDLKLPIGDAIAARVLAMLSKVDCFV